MEVRSAVTWGYQVHRQVERHFRNKAWLDATMIYLP
jgi:hypothetical protein